MSKNRLYFRKMHIIIEIEGKECVVLGRSNIVGKPIAMLMVNCVNGAG